MPSTSPRMHPVGFTRQIVGILVAIAIGLLMVGVFWSIQQTAIAATTSSRIDIAHLVRMSAIQAGLTVVLSLIVGLALAWALNRLHFPGRNIVVGLFAAAIVTPGLVVALGLISVWGRAGWVNTILEPLGLDFGSSIFGLHGILAAHLVLDATFAARILLARLDAMPHTRLKVGQSLALSPFERFRILDWPAISGAIPGLGAIIFLMAFTSFPVVLLLGGGPANQTLEVAIYSSVRLNFDLDTAVQLALVQLAICALVILPAISATPAIAKAGNTSPNNWSDGPTATIVQGLMIAIAVLGFALPLIAVLADGLSGGLLAVASRPSFWQAALTSLTVGVASASLALALSLALSLARCHTKNRISRSIINFPVYAYLVMPAVVLSLGFFIVTRNLGLPPVSAAPFVLIIANALLALPFAVSTLGPAIDAINQKYDRLGRALNLSAMDRWRYVEWPLLGREIGIVLALGFCFSLGDLGVISLFGTENFATLAWVMVRAMGAYRNNDAGAIAAILLISSLLAFWLLPKLFGRLSHARD